MAPRQFTTVIEEGEDGWYVASCPELGTASQGKTPDEAFENLKEATALYLEVTEEPVIQEDRVRQFIAYAYDPLRNL